MKKIKILHVVNSLDPGGMENGVVNIIAALGSEFDFQVACIERRGRFADKLAAPDDVCVLGKQNGFSLQAAARLALEIRKSEPDVIHTHNLGPLIYGSLATLGGLLRPIVHGEHSQLTPEECSPRRLRQRRLLYRCCSQIHTVSRSQREELTAKGFSRICAIVNGVDVNRFSPPPTSKAEAKQRIGIPNDSLVIGTVGRFGPFKRHSVLVDAFGAMAVHHSKLHLLLVGSGGPQEADVRHQAEQSQARDRIHFAGFQDEPARFYQAMDFLISPSINEGLSNAALEAMACGIPILAHMACGNEEAITSGRQGMVTDLGSSEKIRTAVGSMIEHKDQFASWSKSARARAVEEFSLDRMMAGYDELYRSVALSK